ncbi:MAG: tRNA (adenosine(37)-N6)-threonylcarbamoyltransferase complex transferase subunit TsaD [Kiritimatiellia bacterium]|jgi:N6-L-threonylcarbamoyladenine synthase|nr:tRNA (adenosine(37)-N6)-threonylcarbamoyltransferase complex transferase subunit TsaD [Kiritimatiellia bacterium]MDP6631115.1 tRNA (adenosine(37)-N6)-threonylcarbamoyltransferase complex transferase subunit TsaD [Kiritimatiellia bacterium]MDP6810072.1 tRNA (adenosine(37)-N6)-threonylcarbamoyltransferase complex transferase subunit TsaD [Kiritimatiellia bacterium]MDP7024843.1 tRNA (adenosine(37)-N6)-threonylcarbamoyltransferase complex transferase subunit TsaD [Kiritimatiellia bacterium]
MRVLGIETSCDETAAAVVVDGRDVLANCIFSQVALHGPYGGVVPEIASRSHVQTLPRMIDQAVSRAELDWSDIDAIGATFGPGLASSLLVGVGAARGLAQRLDRPLIAINHIEAHIYSVFLDDDAPIPEEVMPFIALVVSGGHTMLVLVTGLGQYEVLGRTVDDAAGEAFDKGANLMDLGYPGGPAIDRTAKEGNPEAVRFPRGGRLKASPMLGGMDPALCFSFSGLKTALLYYLRDHPLDGSEEVVADLTASYQEAIVEALAGRCRAALERREVQALAVVGGVSLNSRLRARLADVAADAGVRLLLSKPSYCADNAAMIAGLAGAGRGKSGGSDLAIDIDPNMRL